MCFVDMLGFVCEEWAAIDAEHHGRAFPVGYERVCVFLREEAIFIALRHFQRLAERLDLKAVWGAQEGDYVSEYGHLNAFFRRGLFSPHG